MSTNKIIAAYEPPPLSRPRLICRGQQFKKDKKTKPSGFFVDGKLKQVVRKIVLSHVESLKLRLQHDSTVIHHPARNQYVLHDLDVSTALLNLFTKGKKNADVHLHDDHVEQIERIAMHWAIEEGWFLRKLKATLEPDQFKTRSLQYKSVVGLRKRIAKHQRKHQPINN